MKAKKLSREALECGVVARRMPRSLESKALPARGPGASRIQLQIRANARNIRLLPVHRSVHACPRRMNAMPQPQRYLIHVDQYEKMAEAGVFAPGERVQLIEGEIYSMPPVGERHIWGVAEFTEALIRSPLGQRVFLLPQQPIILSDISEPEPDIVLLRLPKAQYRTRKAGPVDVVLVIEVADSSLVFDRQRKMPLYARSGIPESWILNVSDRCLEAHRRPEDGVYSDVRIYAPGELISLVEFPDIPFDWSVALT
jgi:Uma2 family endonuclease